MVATKPQPVGPGQYRSVRAGSIPAVAVDVCVSHEGDCMPVVVLSLNEYQTEAAKFAIYPKEQGLAYCILGLVGEAGEVANKYKKVIRDEGGELSPEKQIELLHEVGDVLWYAAQVATELGWNLRDIAQGNINKLADRHERNQIGGSGDNR